MSSSPITMPSTSASCTACSSPSISAGIEPSRARGRTVGVRDRVVVEQLDDPAERGFLADREVQRRDAGAEALLELVERARERRALAVELVDEDRARDAALPRRASTRSRSAPRRPRPPTRRTARGRRPGTRRRRRRRSRRSPGVSSRLTFVPSSSNGASASDTEMRRRCSSGSKSQTVVPSSTLPRRGIAPAASRSASASDVLPAPPWPTRATLRMLAVGNVFTQYPRVRVP